MTPYRKSTKNLNTIYILTLAFLTIEHTSSQLAPGVTHENAVFPNQTCQDGKCYKFNLELVQEQWEFLAHVVTPSCCAYSAHNVSYISQVALADSPYKMEETTAMPPQDDQTVDPGLPEISEITFKVEGFPGIDSSDNTSTDRTVQPIPKPAAQKMALAKKVTSELARLKKKGL